MVGLSELSTQEVLKRAADGDQFLEVKFFPQVMKMGFKSKEAGEDIFEEIDFVSIVVPGQTQNTNIFKVTDAYRKNHQLTQLVIHQHQLHHYLINQK